VSITSPANGATVSGSVAVNATASDSVGVTRVEFYVDGTLILSDSSSPYSAAWNSTGAAAGSHTIEARAFDAAGNRARRPSPSRLPAAPARGHHRPVGHHHCADLRHDSVRAGARCGRRL